LDTHAITQAAYYVAFNLTRALTAAIQRDSPLYWPFLVSALTIGLAVALYTRSGRRYGWTTVGGAGATVHQPAHHQLHHSCEQRHHGGVNRRFDAGYDAPNS
jgi:sterol desaturase/sphingolipid hydroxylase (fatty acid hydroxylase superfamily)